MPDLLLGLIGNPHIKASSAPRLHRAAGALTGLEVQYDLIIPEEMDREFEAVLDGLADQGYRGVNVTLPFKERAAARVRIDDPLLRAMGAVNTVIFEPDGPHGYNTDCTGFQGGYRSILGDADPGPVCLIGAGGVGRAIAFGAVALGCTDLRIVDLDAAKATALADALRSVAPDLAITVTADAAEGAKGAKGLANGTPVGMIGYEGTPLPRAAMEDASAAGGWAFDAVYTPIETQFLTDAATAGLTIVSGYELFFFQGVDCWRYFSGREVDQSALRQALAEGA